MGTVQFFDDWGIVSLARLLQRNRYYSLYVCDSDWICSVCSCMQVEALEHNVMSTVSPSTSFIETEGHFASEHLDLLYNPNHDNYIKTGEESEPEPARPTLQ